MANRLNLQPNRGATASLSRRLCVCVCARARLCVCKHTQHTHTHTHTHTPVHKGPWSHFTGRARSPVAREDVSPISHRPLGGHGPQGGGGGDGGGEGGGKGDYRSHVDAGALLGEEHVSQSDAILREKKMSTGRYGRKTQGRFLFVCIYSIKNAAA